jgi:hypothetical protein
METDASPIVMRYRRERRGRTSKIKATSPPATLKPRQPLNRGKKAGGFRGVSPTVGLADGGSVVKVRVDVAVLPLVRVTVESEKLQVAPAGTVTV